MYRDQDKAWIAGIAAGIADYYDTPVFFVRLLFVATFFMFGAGFVLYLWMWSTYPTGSGQIRFT